MKTKFFIFFLMLSISLLAANITEKSFIGKWHVIENGYESEMTFSNGYMTWDNETWGARVYKFSILHEGDSNILNLRLDASFELQLKIESVSKDEIYLSRDDGRILKLSRIKIKK